MTYKTLLTTIFLVATALPAVAQHKTVLYDSTSVVMEESGLSHVTNHQRIRANDYAGCSSLATIKIDYDPLSAYVEFQQVLLHHPDGTSEDVLLRVYDYVAPARLIYWGASQKMVQIGHIDPGDEIEFVTYRKGFTYALLADNDDDSKYIPPMRGHFYDIVPFWSNDPVNQKVYRVSVLTAKNLHFELYNCPADSPVHIDSTIDNDRTIYTFTKNYITPLKREPRALANNDIQCKLLLSTSPNWQAKSIWFYGVNEDYGSFVPTPEVQAKVNELLLPAQSEHDSIAILTHWVADNIRYAGISMGPGEGFTLHNAQMNFTDRCGVCKDKAGMLVTMLRAAGFKAYAAMTMAHERIDRIPADQFNHSVCAVQHRDGSFEMLDPTWVPNVRELWSSAEQQQGYLIGLPDGADLQYTPVSAPENHYIRINAESFLDQFGTLSSTLTITAEGQSDRAVRSVFNCRTAEWNRNLEVELLKIAPQAHIEKITHTSNDQYLKQPVTITYRVTIPKFATVDKNTLIFIPLSARNFYKNAMSHLFFNTSEATRTQPFADACSRLVEIKETITLPDQYKKLHFPFVNGVADPAASFGCQYWIEGNKLTFAESALFGKRVYNASDWPSFRQTVANQQLLATTPVILTK
ncbi:MAG: DUF3857 and transglutaminase domain-containing protein [Bacteroidales bacterium]|nr:DUF3857 and transglutaminase domain-containing protein [Bacteroidales bacterium]